MDSITQAVATIAGNEIGDDTTEPEFSTLVDEIVPDLREAASEIVSTFGGALSEVEFSELVDEIAETYLRTRFGAAERAVA